MDMPSGLSAADGAKAAVPTFLLMSSQDPILSGLIEFTDDFKTHTENIFRLKKNRSKNGSPDAGELSYVQDLLI
jgi:hypothetical protein